MKTIIHVEDSEHIRIRVAACIHAMHSALRLLSADCLAVADEMLAQHTPQFMVLDLSLPDGNAVNSLQRFKTMAPDMRIAVFTHENSHFMRERCQRMGAEWVFEKSTDLPMLIDTIFTTLTLPRAVPQ